MMFYELGLGMLLRVGENENKRPTIAGLVLDFVRKDSQCYFEVIEKVKLHHSGNIRTFSCYLALFI